MAESIRVPYRQDDFGNSMYARVDFVKDQKPKPIALVFHGGGLIIGSSEIVPKPQIDYLTRQGFLVVLPNYRLAPQVTAKQAYGDCEDAYDWAVKDLVTLMKHNHGVHVNADAVVTLGHSSGGTLAMHINAVRPVKAVTALYPNLAISDLSSSSHHPTAVAPYGAFPDFTPSDVDWKSINPAGVQLSETNLPGPGSVPNPRSKWQMSIRKNGQWPAAIQPGGDFAALDHLTRISSRWAPTMILAGAVDDVPGSELVVQKRAMDQLRSAGVEVQLIIVPDASHMFDLPPEIGTTDQGPKWRAVVQGLDWMASHV